MADAKTAIALTLMHEGGYVNNQADPGGATNMGITQKDLPDTPIQTLTVEQAEKYYLDTYWKPIYGSISSQAIASKLFDLGVLFGVGTAVKVLQGIFSKHGIIADGLFGPATLEIVNTAEPIGLLTAYKSAMLERAERVVIDHPNEGIFLSGWKSRINS